MFQEAPLQMVATCTNGLTPVPTISAGSYRALGDGSYFLKSQSSGKYLDVSGPSTADGANVHQWTYTGAGNQRWLLQNAGDGYFFLKAQFSGKYLDVSGVSTAVGANVHQWSYTGATNQQWKLEAAN
jgi:hypothetical protein